MSSAGTGKKPGASRDNLALRTVENSAVRTKEVADDNYGLEGMSGSRINGKVKGAASPVIDSGLPSHEEPSASSNTGWFLFCLVHYMQLGFKFQVRHFQAFSFFYILATP